MLNMCNEEKKYYLCLLKAISLTLISRIIKILDLIGLKTEVFIYGINSLRFGVLHMELFLSSLLIWNFKRFSAI